MVNNSYTQSVEGHKAENRPVESVRLYNTPDGNAQQTFFTPKIRGRTSFSTPDAYSGRGHALEKCRQKLRSILYTIFHPVLHILVPVLISTHPQMKCHRRVLPLDAPDAHPCPSV